MIQHVLTASQLSDGAVVYLGPGGGWSGDIQSGRLVSAGETDTLEAAGQLGLAANIIVAPYVIDVTGADGDIKPVRWRECIRAFGPTVVEQDANSSQNPRT
jgi:hypothetical protein